MDPARPNELQQGIFGGETYDVWLRFSSDVAPNSSDANNGTIGVGIAGRGHYAECARRVLFCLDGDLQGGRGKGNRECSSGL